MRDEGDYEGVKLVGGGGVILAGLSGSLVKEKFIFEWRDVLVGRGVVWEL